MLPPTYLTCLEVGQYADPAAVLDAARDRSVEMFMPRGRARTTTAARSRSRPGSRPCWRPGMSPMSWTGGAFGERAHCVLAPNANMMTLDGTNTWVLREPGARRSVVVDPGPPDESHLDAVAEQAGEVAVVLLTHHHLDHSEAAKEFAERMGCGVRALDPEYRLGSEGLGDGDVVEVDGLEVHVVATPGHTADSLSFVLPAERAVLTGDTVLGRGTTVVAHPDGQLGAYLDSLDRLHALAEAHEIAHHLARPRPGDRRRPGGPRLLHRPPRGAARAGRVGGGRSCATQPHPEGLAADELPRRVVEIVYADVDPVLWGAAELSVRAQLAHLADRD